MTRLLLRNLAYYWRTNLAVVAGVATAVAVLSGALMVGESVRGSLLALAAQRLGATDVVVSSDRFFREPLAAELGALGRGRFTAVPIIQLQGVVSRESASRRTRPVEIYGVDERFWTFHGLTRSGPDGRTALVGAPLASALGIAPGDPLLLRVDTAGAVPRESLYGRRETVGRTLRLTAGDILPATALGEFALRSSQGEVLALFVPLERLQRDLDQPGRVNTLLVTSPSHDTGADHVAPALAAAFTLADAGVIVRPVPRGRGAIVEHDRLLLSVPLADAALAAAADLSIPASAVFSYLANSIRANGRAIPYSVITAADLGRDALTDTRGVGSAAPPVPGENDGTIWLNEWAARELAAKPGDGVEVEYYRWHDDGRLTTESARFTLARVVSIGGDVDTSLAPDVPGVSDATSMGDWDPPFPLDLGRIRPEDEAYWATHRATPKAFVTLARGRALWGSRHGVSTSVRAALPPPASPSAVDDGDLAARMAAALRQRLTADAAGFVVTPVREASRASSRGSTDFGEYFVYFSFFLIAAAVLLAALFFRLGIEQRVREIGTLAAVGFSGGHIRRLFLAEGTVLSLAGGVLGVAGALAYGAALVFGLRTWWIDAIGTRQVFLHVTARDLAIGVGAGVVASIAAVLWTLRGVRRRSPRALLTGALESDGPHASRARLPVLVSVGSAIAALALLVGSAMGRVPDVAGFFGAGGLLFVAMLTAASLVLRRASRSPIASPGWVGLARLGARQLTARPGRSLLCIALIAFATFVIVSVEAFRKDGALASHEAHSGTGGFPLVATSSLPVFEDPNTAAGREALGIDANALDWLSLRFVPFRERPGEDASCLNLYAPREPRILGAPASFLLEDRFSFQSSLATADPQRQNPWLLLDTPLPDGAIPAIGDANTLQYVLHLGLGDDLVIRGDGGSPVRLRLVAALRDSVLQGEIVISDSQFRRVFPSNEGFRFFLIAVAPEKAPALVAPLEEALADRGVRVEESAVRLAGYHRVENTYLSTFQSLGGLGLLLGTLGLAAVLLRNVLERRRELALLRAVGYSARALSLIVVVENVLLMVLGLACGAVCAVLAILPAIGDRGGSVPLGAAGLMLVAVLVGGVLSSLVAVVAVWRMPLLASIRHE